jgi:uncharacterized membrane protein
MWASSIKSLAGVRFARGEGTIANQWIGDAGNIQARGFAVSSDNEATIRSGLTDFMRAERAILAMQKRRERIASVNALRDPKLDVANLIYQLQLLYEGEAGGRADGGTEEIRQLHKLLQDYGIMQRLVQETIKHYDSSEPEEKRRFLNLGGRDNGSVQENHTNRSSSEQDTQIVFRLVNADNGSLWSVQSPGGRETAGLGRTPTTIPRAITGSTCRRNR